MTMAKDIGINTSEFQLIKNGESKHLLIKRFDRDDNDEKIHMCTASGLMHINISIIKATSRMIELDEDTIQECKKDIDSQIKLLEYPL